MGSTNKNLGVGIKVGGRIIVKVTWRERLELILIFIVPHGLGVGLK